MMKKLFLIFVSLFFVLFSTFESYSYSKLSPVKTKFGLHQAAFPTNSGKITVSLPSDMVPGETISGSVIYNGNPSQFDLIIEGKIISLIGNNFTIKLPNSITTGVISVVLRYLNGTEIGRAFFPTNLVKLNNLNRAASNFKLPVHGRSGVPSEVLGPFDGNYENTSISLSGKPLIILAESTGKMVFLSSNSHQGSGTLNLSESGQLSQGKYTNLVVVKVGEEMLVSDNTEKDDVPKEEEFQEIVDPALEQEPSETIVAKNNDQEVTVSEEEIIDESLNIDTEQQPEVKRKEVIEIIDKKATETKATEKDFALIEEDVNNQLNSIYYDSNKSKQEEIAKINTKPVVEKELEKEIDFVDPTFETEKVSTVTANGKKFCIQLASFKIKLKQKIF